MKGEKKEELSKHDIIIVTLFRFCIIPNKNSFLDVLQDHNT